MPIPTRQVIQSLPGLGPGRITENPLQGLQNLPAVDLRLSGIVPRTTLNRAAPLTPPQIPDNYSAVGKVIPQIYGEARAVAGHFKTVGNTAASNFRYVLLYLVCEGEIEGYQKLFVDGREVDVSGWSLETWTPNGAFGTNGQGILFVGNGTQDVGSDISTFYSGYTDTLEDYAIVGLLLDGRVVQRLPRVEVLVQGQNNVKDYTLGTPTAGYTDNLGNILIHWIEVVEGRSVDATTAKELADACAEDVGNGTKRRVGGIVLNKSQDTRLTREVLRAHAASYIVDTGAEVLFVPDRPADPVMDIGPSILVGDTVVEGPSLQNKPDDVVVIWTDPVTGTEQRASATGALSGKISVIRMPGITTAAQAKREAIERYNHLTLEGDTITFTVRDEGAKLFPGKVVRFTDPKVGIQDKPYRVISQGIPDQRPGAWRFRAQEYQPNSFSDSVQEDPLIGDTNLENPQPDAPNVVTVQLLDTTSSPDSGYPVITWTVDDDTNINFYEVEISDAQLKPTGSFNDNWDTPTHRAFARSLSWVWIDTDSVYYRFRVRS